MDSWTMQSKRVTGTPPDICTGKSRESLMLALYLRIIDEQENDRRYKALQDKFYDAF